MKKKITFKQLYTEEIQIMTSKGKIIFNNSFQN